MPDRPHKAGPVLLVEDDPELREALDIVMRSQGYDVVTASNGEEAFAHLHDPLPPSVIVLDLMLPVMDGFEFRVRQLEDPALASIPVIVLSAGGDLANKTATMRAAACLQKPIGIEELLEHVERLTRDGDGNGARTR